MWFFKLNIRPIQWHTCSKKKDSNPNEMISEFYEIEWTTIISHQYVFGHVSEFGNLSAQRAGSDGSWESSFRPSSPEIRICSAIRLLCLCLCLRLFLRPSCEALLQTFCCRLGQCGQDSLKHLDGNVYQLEP